VSSRSRGSIGLTMMSAAIASGSVSARISGWPRRHGEGIMRSNRNVQRSEAPSPSRHWTRPKEDWPDKSSWIASGGNGRSDECLSTWEELVLRFPVSRRAIHWLHWRGLEDGGQGDSSEDKSGGCGRAMSCLRRSRLPSWRSSRRNILHTTEPIAVHARLSGTRRRIAP